VRSHLAEAKAHQRRRESCRVHKGKSVTKTQEYLKVLNSAWKKTSHCPTQNAWYKRYLIRQLFKRKLRVAKPRKERAVLNNLRGHQELAVSHARATKTIGGVWGGWPLKSQKQAWQAPQKPGRRVLRASIQDRKNEGRLLFIWKTISRDGKRSPRSESASGH